MKMTAIFPMVRNGIARMTSCFANEYERIWACERNGFPQVFALKLDRHFDRYNVAEAK